MQELEAARASAELLEKDLRRQVSDLSAAVEAKDLELAASQQALEQQQAAADKAAQAALERQQDAEQRLQASQQEAADAAGQLDAAHQVCAAHLSRAGQALRKVKTTWAGADLLSCSASL